MVVNTMGNDIVGNPVRFHFDISRLLCGNIKSFVSFYCYGIDNEIMRQVQLV